MQEPCDQGLYRKYWKYANQPTQEPCTLISFFNFLTEVDGVLRPMRCVVELLYLSFLPLCISEAVKLASGKFALGCNENEERNADWEAEVSPA